MLCDAGNGRVLVWGRHGLFLANGADIYVGRSLIAYGEYCQSEVDALLARLPERAHVVEVGANCGAVTVPLAKKAARVLAIEAQPGIHRQLATNCELNDLQNVETMCAAVGDRTGTLLLPKIDYHNADNYGGVEIMALAGEEGAPVPLIRLDDLRLEKCDLLKIDVEGMECAVLRGGAEMIARCRPVISVENDRPAQAEELCALLRGMGYRLHWLIDRLYNENNYAGNGVNIYGIESCANMLCLLPEHGDCDLPRVDEGDEHPFVSEPAPLV